MKKLVAMAALVAGLMASTAAIAAPVDIILTQNGLNSTDWNLTINNNSAVGVGGINFEVTGLNVMVVNPSNPGISAPESAINVDAFGPGDSYAGIAAVAGASTAPAGTLNNLLATLSGASTGVSLIPSETNAGSPTAFTFDGQPIPLANISMTVVPFQVVPPVVPEPATALLLALGLGGVAFARRRTA